MPLPAFPPRVADVLDRLPETRWPRLCLMLLCLALWLPGFASLPQGDRDESRFAQASRQMVESGDYVRIRFGEEERNKKPAGIHWAQAASVHVAETLGIGGRDQIWPYRLPSFLGALAAVLATFHWGRALVGRRAAFTAAAMLAASTVLVVETHIAKTDAALLGTVAVAMGLLGRAYLSPGTFSTRQAAGFWAVLGLSILLKGPIGPLVALLTVITLAAADRAGAWLKVLKPAWGIPLMLAVAAPWFVAIGIATEGRFFADAVGGDMLNKVNSGEEAHWGPPGYYLLTFALSAFPAGFLVLRALPTAWRDRLNPGTRFLLAWIAPSWLMFEAVATKLPHYTLPVFPALMLLGAAWAMDPLRRPAPRWLAWLGAGLLSVVAVALGVAAGVLPWLADHRIDPLSLLVLPFALLLLWAVFACLRDNAPGRAALAAAVLAVPIYAGVLGGLLPRLEAPWIGPRVAQTLAAQGLTPPGGEGFGIVGYHEPSLVFATGTRTALLRDGTAAADYLAAAPGRVVAIGDRDLARFQAEAARLDLAPQPVGEVAGYNYTRGRRLVLRLFRLAPA
ncbi:dolichyl-phosphate-mannose-protein mannosyltransferase [Pseudoroseomonas deserti]|uniref:Dolichyl-phosphate-mannose-protein mannosyltransferase n=1 Tax=Teichococcus deserti TaxID=1817963 RepID=A0A1V2GV45_9PROT|nr:glycosyltransferase family 39 protein [Pseudoroseomonas deserti]ONG46199.1 dolichyl-phosphate-mannose-protein mannosyltransferase [Pseudoroseomonas deserti]